MEFRYGNFPTFYGSPPENVSCFRREKLYVDRNEKSRANRAAEEYTLGFVFAHVAYIYEALDVARKQR